MYLYKSIKNNLFLFLYLGIIFFYYLLIGNYSLNIQDEAGELVGQQQIFNAPESVYYQFMYYLGMLVGGVWHAVFGDFGVYGSRLFSAITITATFYFVYRMLKGHVNQWFVLLAAVIGIVLLPNRFAFHHNYLTALLTTVSAYYLYLSLKNKRCSYILIAGVLLGINVFSRVSNLALAGMIFALIPFYVYNKDWKLVGRMFLYALGGFALGILFVFGVMAALGHLNLFFDAMADLFLTGNESDSNHHFLGLVQSYISDSILIVKMAILLFGIPATLYIIDKWVKGCRTVKSVLYFCALLVVMVIYYRYVQSFYTLNAFCLFVLSCSLYKYRKNVEIVYLIVIALLVEYLQPIGGDIVFPNIAYNNLYLSFPLAMGLAFDIIRNSVDSRAAKTVLYSVLGVFSIALLSRGVLNSLNYLHSDQNPISWNQPYSPKTPIKKLFTCNLTYEPKIDKLNVYVTEELGKQLEEIGSVLGKYVQKNDYLLCIQHEPIIHYITETRPYLYNYWIWTYDPSVMQKQIERARQEISELPVVLFSKIKENEDHLLTSLETGRYDYENTFFANKNRNKVLVNFIKNNGYRMVWENEYYGIFLPPNFK